MRRVNQMIRGVVIVALVPLNAEVATAALPFPGVLPGAEIGGELPGTFEPSGIAWHSKLEVLFVVCDSGYVATMTCDGADVVIDAVSGDLEGICIADPESPFAYVGIEHPDGILEYDWQSGTVTRAFNLTAYMTGPSNRGLEALTFVPDAAHPEGGLFYAGLQDDGRIYVFELPIQSSSTSTDVVFLETITPVPGRTDISGLHYAEEHGLLYAVWDSANRMAALEPDGTLVADWELAGNDQEGIAVVGCELFIAEDVGVEVWCYHVPAFESQEQATGDLNCDGSADLFDIDPFVIALSNPGAYRLQYPDCDRSNADCNDDGIVDSHDIDAFVALLCELQLG